jgi:hypothetical protein
VGKPEGKITTKKPGHRWEDNIKTDFGEIGWGGMDWKDLAQDRCQWTVLVKTVMEFRVP